MHQFSFDFGDPFFDLDGWQVGLQVITFENTYGLDPGRTRLTTDENGFTVVADGLASPPEVRQTIDELYAFADDPHTVHGGPRVFQAFVRAPASRATCTAW